MALALVPAAELPVDDARFAMLIDFIHGARDRHHVDADYVVEFPSGDLDNFETIVALEKKYRPRATCGVADHESRDLVPAGFLEVFP